MKGMGDGTLICLLHVTPKIHTTWVSDQPNLDLRREQESFIRRHNSNIAIEPPTKLLPLSSKTLAF